MSYNDKTFLDKVKNNAGSLAVVLTVILAWLIVPAFVPEDNESLFKEVLAALSIIAVLVTGYKVWTR